MTGIPKEKDLEALMEEALLCNNDYIQGAPDEFDRTLALDKVMLLRFLEQTQGEKLEQFKKINGGNWEKALMDAICSQIETRGLIEVLRHGVEHYSINGALVLAYFKPNSNLNKRAWELYGKNILAVTRQLKYSLSNENSLDMVLFLNGFPVVVLELKNQFTGQTVRHAMKQFREDRNSKEPIFHFNKRVLVYFAVDTDEVRMTTQLKDQKTHFLPFNRGNNGGKGNPPVEGKMKTFYLWEQILQKESLLDILKRFYFIQSEDIKTDEGKKFTIHKAVFPRYHQLDVVRKTEQFVLTEGIGQRYLVQHSAGSGKTNSISWLAHRLSTLHNSEDENVFDSVIVITDRKVLDRQLQEAIYQLDHKKGVVVKIDEKKTSKHLAEALKDKAKIIITTIQKFPFALEKIDELEKGKYAVIIDEAHSSTSGESMAALKETLAGKTLKEAAELERDPPNDDDKINEILEKRTDTARISFFAFTATPKNKTLQIFGRMGGDEKPHEFHLYSMRQAIEEKFILDVLKNYATYDVYYKVGKKIEDNPEFDKGKAKSAITRFVSLNEYNIRQKVEVVVEDFMKNRAMWLNGKAKGMVVTASRLHAVRYKLAIDAFIKEKKYPIKSLVAFSGVVKDDGEEYTEVKMNSIKDESETAELFDTEDSCKLLIVAEKFQTGFDQPKLCVMYVDKKLDGVKTVQTLSRLNRTRADKERTFILDFINNAIDIKEAFAPYYEQTNIEEITEPSIVFDAYFRLNAIHVYQTEEVERYVSLYLKDKRTGRDDQQMNSLVDKAVERFMNTEEDEQQEFKTLAVKYIRIYNFLIQIYPLRNVNLYKLHVYLCGLLKKLPKDELDSRLNLDDLLSLDYYKMKQIAGEGAKGEDISFGGDIDAPDLTGFTGGGASRKKEDELDSIESIIDRINKVFGIDITEADRVATAMNQMTEDFKSQDAIRNKVMANTYDDFRESFEKNDFLRGLVRNKKSNQQIFDRMTHDKNLQNFVVAVIAKELYNHFSA